MGLGDVSQVYLVGSEDRAAATALLLQQAGLDDLSGKHVVLKANFNSSDPFPASTHPDTLRALVTTLGRAQPRDITLAERSGMGDTRIVLEKLGIFDMAAELGFAVTVLDDEPTDRWAHIERTGTHWMRGFYLTKLVLEADVVIQTCCLKTHRFGGHFTMSLKNSVGLVAKRMPGGLYDYMYELHGSPFQRHMIAEINDSYALDFAVMDATKGFIDGGPDKGTLVEPGLMLGSSDRVALDAAGVALLRAYGAKGLMKKPVFEMTQIRRAAELGIGAGSPDAMELVPLDGAARAAAARIEAVLGASPGDLP